MLWIRISLVGLAAVPWVVHAAGLSMADRQHAAQQTVDSAAACQQIQPFYWEVGDRDGLKISGQSGRGAPSRTDNMPVASASKWIYSAYVVQKKSGVLSSTDIQFLNFQSGYTYFHGCRRSQTVSECLSNFRNGRGKPDPETEGRFYYSGGHFQKHAVLMGLGDLDAQQLGEAVSAELEPFIRPGWAFGYKQAQPAGGGFSSAEQYGAFLQALLANKLALSSLLGTHAVCTNPATCPGGAVSTPIPQSESWRYSLGHWVESDPVQGDGAFSSPGAFGFYPWVSADKTWYGMVVRDSFKHLLGGDESEKPGVQSVYCGRLIRKAWLTGLPQLTSP